MAGRLIGEAYISLLPDASLFRPDADAKVKSALAGLSGKIRLTGDLSDVDKKVAALAATLKGISNQKLSLDSREAVLDVEELADALADLREHAENIPLDMNDSKGLAKLFTMMAGIDALAKKAEDMDADFNIERALAKFYTLEAGVKSLDEALSKVGGVADPLPTLGIANAATALGGMAERLTSVNKYLQQTGEVGSHSFDTLNLALGEANAEFTRLSGEGANAGNITQIKNLDAAIKQLSTDTGLSASEADSAYHGFGLLGRAIGAIKNTSIPLYGGALEGIAPKFLADASGIHLLIEGIVEFTAVWGPALLALSAFAALAYKTGKDVFDQFTSMNTVVEATGAKFTGLKGTLQGWENAIQPQVLQLFGDYLTLAGNNAGHFQSVMEDVGRVLDEFGAKLTVYLNSKTTSIFLNKAAGDIAGLGIAFTQIGRIIETLLQAVPGYAQMLLKFGDAFLTVTADAVSGLEPVIALFLKLHGAEFYLGLATTAVLVFGRSFAAAAIAKNADTVAQSLGAFGTVAANWAGDFTSDNEKVAEAAGNSGSKLSKWAGGLGGLFGGIIAAFTNAGRATLTWTKETSDLVGTFGASETAGLRFEEMLVKIPGISKDAQGGLSILGSSLSLGEFGIAALAIGALGAAIGVVLYEALRSTTPEVTQFSNQMQKLVLSSNIVNVQANIAAAIKDTASQIQATAGTIPKLTAQYQALAKAGTNTLNIHDVGQEIQQTEQAITQYQTQIAGLASQSDLAAKRTGPLVTQFGSLQSVMELATLAGVKQNAVVADTAKQWAQDRQAIEATAAAYGFMGQQAGAAGNQLDALNIQEGNNYKAVQALTQAESAWISLITSGDSGFTAFEQGFPNLTGAMGKTASGADSVSVTVGKLQEKFLAFGATMNGTSQASLAVRQAFDSQLSAAVTLYGNLQTLSAATGNTKTSQQELAKSGKDIIAQMLPFAAGSKQATAELSSLAQLMGGPATDNFQVLAKWVGSTKGAEADLNTEQAKLTISSANLTTASKNLGNAIMTDVTNMEASKIATANLGGAVNGLYKASTQAKNQVTSFAVQQAGEYVTAMKNAGIGTQQAEQYLNAYLKQLGYGPQAISAIDSQLGDSVGQWTKYDSAVTQNTAAAKAFLTASTGNRNALAALSGLLPMTATQYNALWGAVVKQDQAMVTSGKDATGAKSQFVDFANNGLHVAASDADALWKKFGQQNLDTLASKAGSTKTSFIQFAENGLHLSTTQAQLLWSEFATQNLDMLASKGNSTKNTFIQLAKNGLDLTTSEAVTLWNTLRGQYLDTLAAKAGETKNAFIQTARQFGVTASAAQQLWDKLHQIPANVHTNVSETLSGSGEIKAQITAKSLTLTSAGSAPVPGVSSSGALSAAGMAAGGVVAGGIHGKDSVHTILAPGELVIPSTHAAMFGAAAKRAGIPMAAGGVVGSPTATVANIGQGLSTAQSGIASMTAGAMKTFVGLITGAAEQIIAASGSAGSGNLLSIAKFFLANGANAAAAAGIAADISGECVTFDTMILTKRGWLKHDEVQPGDETIGYNPATGKSEWTPITRVMHYAQKPVVTYGNKYWEATFTPNHRWLTERVTRTHVAAQEMLSCPLCGHASGYEGRPVTTRGMLIHMGKAHPGRAAGYRTWQDTEVISSPALTAWRDLGPGERLVLSREADTGVGLPISDQEAGLLGWIAGDGSVMADGRVFVYQSKVHNFPAIEACMPAARSMTQRDRRGKNAKGFGTTTLKDYTWYIKQPYAADLLHRAGNPKTEAFTQVMAMSSSQRKAWLAAMIAAEGSVSPARTVVYQNEGNIAEAIELAVYLEGYRPSRNVRRDNEVTIGLTAPTVGGPKRRSFTKDAGLADVWCVTTGLGSWTARNASGMFLTGNSGGNPEARQAGGGGQGLIQWTGNSQGIPSGQAIITGNVARDMSVQLRGVLGYIAGRGGLGAINAAGSPVLAGEVFSRMLAPAVTFSDTRPAVAEQLFAELATGSSSASKAAKARGGMIKPFSTGGTINEPVSGVGLWSHMPYSFAENGPEVVSNVGQVAAASSSGMPAMTTYQGQTLISLMQMLVKQNQQFPQAVGSAIGNAGKQGVAHGYFGAQG